MTTPATFWDLEVELPLLAAAQTPVTARELTALTGLPADTVTSQLHALKTGRLVIESVGIGVRYQLTLTGRRRLIALSRPESARTAA